MTQDNAPKPHYQASISSDKKHWEWRPSNYRPQPLMGDDIPTFQCRDKLTIRVKDCTGIHHVSLTPVKGREKGPFMEPFDSLEFDYDPDKDLLCITDYQIGAVITWKFRITPPGGSPIDPEFHVGPGGF